MHTYMHTNAQNPTAYSQALLSYAVDKLSQRWGTESLFPANVRGNMALIRLPEDVRDPKCFPPFFLFPGLNGQNIHTYMFMYTQAAKLASTQMDCVCSWIKTYMHTYIRTYINTCSCIHRQQSLHQHLRIAYVHWSKHTYIHNIHTYIHVHLYIGNKACINSCG
jgi:hypothetical protein